MVTARRWAANIVGLLMGIREWRWHFGVRRKIGVAVGGGKPLVFGSRTRVARGPTNMLTNAGSVA
jgi:hypothetical protein